MDVLCFLIKDLDEHGIQMSWDWEADLRFAIAIGDKKSSEILKRVCYGSAPTAIKWSYVQRTGIPKKRMRYLRKLVKRHKVIAFWSGSEEGGKNRFGVNRFRNYKLADHKPC